MNNIQMVDLTNQYKEIKEEVDQKILEVIENSTFINGPQVVNFQKNLEQYLNVKHVIPCANGTDALQIAIMALDLKPGDEIITADFTFAATVEVIELLGMKSTLIDVDPETFLMDITKIESAITPNSKAIIPVHLFGQCVDMEKILQIAQKHNLYVIEDTAQAIGADYTFSNGEVKKAGTIGHIGTTSFFPSKNLGCFGDGGAIITNDDSLQHKIKAIVNHGMYERYYHDIVGVNSRLDSIQAAILDVKLKRLDTYNKKRLAVAQRYNNEFADISSIIIPKIAENTSHVFHQYTLRITNGKRNEIIEHLKNNNIPAMVYYPVPLHSQKAYKKDFYKESDFEVSNILSKEVFSLPIHTELDDVQLEYIIAKVKEFFI